MKQESEAMDRMVKARCGLLVREPFFGTLALRLELIEDAKVETMSTDGKDLRFNPTWMMALPLPEVQAIVAHEVMHCALLHHTRRGEREPGEWNDATDHAINHELTAAGFQLPEGALMDPEFKGMSADAIYNIIHARKLEQPEDSSGSASGSGKGESSTGKFEDAPGVEGEEQADEAGRETEENTWQQAVAQAAAAARGCGHMPGNIDRAIESTLQPKVDWREALQRLIQSKTKDDYNWSRPNSRFLAHGLFMPSLDSPKCGTLGFAIDASGSIRKAQLDQFIAEVEDARNTLRPERTVVMVFDTQVKDSDVFIFDEDEPIVIMCRAGGGTRFDGPVLKLDELAIQPEVLVYLTDLDASVWPEEPSYPVVWVTTRPGKAPFGEVIEMH